MSVAPEPYRTACLEAVFYAAIEARALAWQGANPEPAAGSRYEQIADLMDAIHNIPHLVNDWERCDPNMLRSFLLSYDEKWADGRSYRLAKIYDEAVKRGSDEGR